MKVTAENISRIAKNLFSTDLNPTQAQELSGAISKGFDENTGSFSSKKIIPEKVPIGYNGKTIEGFNSFDELQAKRKDMIDNHGFSQENVNQIMKTHKHELENNLPLTHSEENYNNWYNKNGRLFDEDVYPSYQELSNIDKSKIMYEDNALSVLLGNSGKTEAEAAEALDFLFDKSAGKEFSNEALSNLKTAQERTGEYGLGMMSLPTKGNGLDLLGSNEMTAAIGGGVIGGAVNSAFGGDFESGFMAGGLAGGLGKSLHKHIAGSADDLLRMEKNAIRKVLDPEKSYDDLLKEKKAVYQSEKDAIPKDLENLRNQRNEVNEQLNYREYDQTEVNIANENLKYSEAFETEMKETFNEEQLNIINRAASGNEAFLDNYSNFYNLNQDQVNNIVNRNSGDFTPEELTNMSTNEKKLYDDLSSYTPADRNHYDDFKNTLYSQDTDMLFNARYSAHQQGHNFLENLRSNALQHNQALADQKIINEANAGGGLDFNAKKMNEINAEKEVNDFQINQQAQESIKKNNDLHFPKLNPNLDDAINRTYFNETRKRFANDALEQNNQIKDLQSQRTTLNENINKLNTKGAELDVKMQDDNLHKELLKEASTKELGDSAGFMQKRSQNLIKPGTRKEQKSLGIDSRHMVLGGAALAGGIFGSRKRDHSRGFNSHRGSRI